MQQLDPEVMAALQAAQAANGGGMPMGAPPAPGPVPGLPMGGMPPGMPGMMPPPGLPGMPPMGMPGMAPPMGVPGLPSTDPAVVFGQMQQMAAQEDMMIDQQRSQAMALAAQQLGVGAPNPYEGMAENGLPFPAIEAPVAPPMGAMPGGPMPVPGAMVPSPGQPY